MHKYVYVVDFIIIYNYFSYFVDCSKVLIISPILPAPYIKTPSDHKNAIPTVRLLFIMFNVTSKCELVVIISLSTNRCVTVLFVVEGIKGTTQMWPKLFNTFWNTFHQNLDLSEAFGPHIKLQYLYERTKHYK